MTEKDTIVKISREYSELYNALKEALKLQSHYAKLLNQYDGGKRISFESPEEFIERLRKLRKEKQHG